MQNSEVLAEKVTTDNNVIGVLLAKNLDNWGIITELYERAYSRPPTDREKVLLTDYVTSETEAGRVRRRELEGILWSLLNSKEFQLNH